MASIISSAATVFAWAVESVGTVAATITGEPLLLLFCTLPIVGIGVGLFRRLINVN